MADFDTDLGRQAANFAALTPIDFLLRAQEVYPEHTAIIHGDLRAHINNGINMPIVSFSILALNRMNVSPVILNKRSSYIILC